MPRQPPRRRSSRTALLWGGLLGLLIGAALAGVAQLPGGLAQIGFDRLFTAGRITYAIPTSLLQEQIAAAYPQTHEVQGLLQVVLKNPRLVPDADASFLRLRLDLEARILGNPDNPTYPGRGAVRARLRFDRAAGRVVLDQVQLAEFSLPEEIQLIAAGLRPLVQAQLTTMLEGFAVYHLPRDGAWWQRAGLGLVRDVRVEGGEVVVAVGF